MIFTVVVAEITARFSSPCPDLLLLGKGKRLKQRAGVNKDREDETGTNVGSGADGLIDEIVALTLLPTFSHTCIIKEMPVRQMKTDKQGKKYEGDVSR